jgi:AcrR family transcriptional regulator
VESIDASNVEEAGSVSENRPRKEPVQARSKVTVDAVLEATAQLLVEHGYEATSTNRVAKRAGISVGSLYQYFPSKESLVAELIDRQADAMLTMMLEQLTLAMGLSFADSARLLVRTIFRAFADHGALNKVLLQELHRVGRMDKLHELEIRAVQVIQLYLQTQRAIVRPADLEMAARLVLHMVDATAITWTVHYPEQLRDARLANEVTDLILRYLLESPPSPSGGDSSGQSAPG